jgi:hypothetical protein
LPPLNSHKPTTRADPGQTFVFSPGEKSIEMNTQLNGPKNRLKLWEGGTHMLEGHYPNFKFEKIALIRRPNSPTVSKDSGVEFAAFS